MYLLINMLIASATILSVVATPILTASACISKLFSFITRIKPLDVSRESFIKEMKTPIANGLTSRWTCDNKVHVLCRHATVFSNYPPVVIIHGTASCSFNYSEFMESFPTTHDVYCIDMPGWGISEDPPFDLGTTLLERCYSYYGNIIMTALSEVYPVKDARFVFVGHSLGAFILTKTIACESIPSNAIHKCVLVCPAGLDKQVSKYAYFWGSLFITGIMESSFKQWWSKHLFSAFLYRKKTQLQTLKNMHRFIPIGKGYKIAGRHMAFQGLLFRPEWVRPVRNELIHIFKYKCKVELIGGLTDTIVNPQHIKSISSEFKNIEYHELNGGHSLFLQNELFQSLIDIINIFPKEKGVSRLDK